MPICHPGRDLRRAAAAHAQDDTAEYLAGEPDSDYFLFAKGNRPGLQRAIYDTVNADRPGQPDHVELDYGHGRIIKRSPWVSDAGDIPLSLNDRSN